MITIIDTNGVMLPFSNKPLSLNRVLYEGKHFSEDLYFYETNNLDTAKDLSNYTVNFAIKQFPGDREKIINKSITPGGSNNNLISLELTTGETNLLASGEYISEIQIETNGKPTIVGRIKFEVKKPINL